MSYIYSVPSKNHAVALFYDFNKGKNMIQIWGTVKYVTIKGVKAVSSINGTQNRCANCQINVLVMRQSTAEYQSHSLLTFLRLQAGFITDFEGLTGPPRSFNSRNLMSDDTIIEAFFKAVKHSGQFTLRLTIMTT